MYDTEFSSGFYLNFLLQDDFFFSFIMHRCTYIYTSIIIIFYLSTYQQLVSIVHLTMDEGEANTSNEGAASQPQSASELSKNTYGQWQLLCVQSVKAKTEDEVEIPSSGAESEAEKTFVGEVMGAIQNETLKENELQNHIFCAIKDLENVTTTEALHKNPPTTNVEDKCNEKNIKSLLEIYLKHLQNNGFDLGDTNMVTKRMKNAQPGLVVTTTSRPDFAFLLSAEDSIDGKIDMDITFGEIKNHDKYWTQDAVNQEILYLMALQYWWKVICAREVDDVYGFTICGQGCKDMKPSKRTHYGNRTSPHYMIAIIKLSASKKLGHCKVATVLQKCCSITEPDGAHLLFRFLSRNLNRIGNKPKIPEPCAAWMSAPAEFVRLVDAPNGWSLMKNGTLALVFHCYSKDGVKSLLSLVEEAVGKADLIEWNEYLQKSKKTIFFIKVNMGRDQNPRAMVMMAHHVKIVDLKSTYPVNPVLLQKSGSFFVLMNKRGEPIKPVFSISMEVFKQKYKLLWDQTVASSGAIKLCHGDIAEHNLLIEGNHLTDEDWQFVLIDWDEAAIYPKPRDANGDKEAVLRHLEALRDEQELYTDVQLAILYCRLKFKYVESAERTERRETWDIEKAEEVKTFWEAVQLPAKRQSVDNNEDVLRASNEFVQACKAELF
jgi:hypothetical protein